MGVYACVCVCVCVCVCIFNPAVRCEHEYVCVHRMYESSFVCASYCLYDVAVSITSTNSLDDAANLGPFDQLEAPLR